MKKIFLITIFSIFGLIGLAFGQTEKDAIKSLKKLEAKIESGISYQRYREILGDTNAEVKLFLESKNAKKSPELNQSINKIMENYKDAAGLWQTIVNNPGRVPYFSPDEKINPYHRSEWHIKLVETAQRFFKKYPKSYDKVKKHREDSIGPLTGNIIPAQKEISLDDFLGVIWNEASKELKKLSID